MMDSAEGPSGRIIIVVSDAREVFQLLGQDSLSLRGRVASGGWIKRAWRRFPLASSLSEEVSVSEIPPRKFS